MNSNLAEDILSSKPEEGPLIVNIIGAGGKTTMMFYLAELFRTKMMSVLVTTTTKIYIPRENECDHLFIGSVQEAAGYCSTGKVICAAPTREEGKLVGYEPDQISLLSQSPNFPDVILVEADGAARKPLKKHKDHEPAIVLNAQLTLIVAGMSAYNKPISNETIHRLREDEKSFNEKGKFIDAALIASILKDYLLQLAIKRKNGHFGRDIIVLNQSDGNAENAGLKVAEFFSPSQALYQMSFRSFLKKGKAGAGLVFQQRLFGTCRLAAVLLAAGCSQRMGQNKLLLPWQGSTILGTVLENVLRAQLEPLFLVIGGYADEIKDILPESLSVVYNDHYQSGQSSSLKCGIEAVERFGGDACLCMLGDMPEVDSKILNRLVLSFVEEKPDILIPLYHGKRGNPVILKRTVFHKVKKITGDVGARVLFSDPSFDILEIETGCRGITTDIDTYEEYEKMLNA